MIPSVLAKANETHIRRDHFPYLVLPDALPGDLLSDLMAFFPEVDVIAKGKPYGSNERKELTIKDVEGEWGRDVAPLWKPFLRRQADLAFLADVVRLFGRDIEKRYPSFMANAGGLSALRSGIRFIDESSEEKVLMDAHISINTPVIGSPSSVRVSHVDDPLKLYAGLLYLRDPRDDSEGGEFITYRYKDCYRAGAYRFFNQHIDYRYVEEIERVPYESNMLVFFINSIHSLHGVSPRAKTAFPRRFVNLVGEVNQELFDLKSVQENRLKKKWRYLNARFLGRRPSRS